MDSLKVLSLRDNEYAVARMEEYIEAQKEAVRNAELQVEEARQKLQEVMTERKAQDSLGVYEFVLFMEEEYA